MIKCKFFSNDFGMMLDVTHIDFANNKFDVKHNGHIITLDNIDNVMLDTGDKLIKLESFKVKPEDTHADR